MLSLTNSSTQPTDPNCRPKGSLVAWGSNGLGKCNVPDDNDFITLAAGRHHSLALRSDGFIAAWGDPALCQAPHGNDFIAIVAGHVQAY